MEIRHLRYFLAVAEQLSFTRAAEQLHVTQPTLSQQIVELENQLGIKLFQRGKRGTVLTEAGQALTEEAQSILARREQALQRMARFLEGGAGTLTVGTLEYFDATILPALTLALRQQHPDIRVLWQQYPLNELRASLNSGTLDLNVTIIPKRLELSGMVKLVVNSDRLTLVAPKESALAKIGAFIPERIAPLLSRPLFLWKEWYQDESGQMIRKLREFCPVLDIRPTGNLNSCLMNTLVENGYSILPYHVVLNANRTHFSCIPLPFAEAELDMAILHRKDSPNPCLPYFMEVARQFALNQ